MSALLIAKNCLEMKTKLLLFVAILIAQAHWVKADEVADEIRALKKQIEELNQKVSALEQKDKLTAETAANKAKESPLVSAGADGFIMRSADTNFVLRIRGYGQFDGRFYAEDNSANDAFVMRRLRLGLEGTVYKYYDYRILTDFGSGITSTTGNNAFLQDALVNIHYWPEFQIQFGKYKEPVSLEVLQSDASLLFVERGLPTALAPNRDVGIQFQGDLLDARLSYALGIFNGVADGGSGDVETSNSGKHFAGRIFSQPFKNFDNELFRGIAIGIGGSFGDQAESLPSYVTTGRQRFFTFGTNSLTTSVAADGRHWRVAPQGYYYYGPFGIYGEYVLSSVEVSRTGAAGPPSLEVDNEAWNIAISYVLTGEKNSFNRISPHHPVDLSNDGWGAWEIAARFGELSIDKTAFPLVATSSSAQKVISWEIGLNWYLNKNLKFNFDYTQSHFSGGSKTPGSVTAQDEKVFMGRTQFSF
jgi:phosphate-selective porin OprO and OprP